MGNLLRDLQLEPIFNAAIAALRHRPTPQSARAQIRRTAVVCAHCAHVRERVRSCENGQPADPVARLRTHCRFLAGDLARRARTAASSTACSNCARSSTRCAASTTAHGSAARTLDHRPERPHPEQLPASRLPARVVPAATMRARRVSRVASTRHERASPPSSDRRRQRRPA